MDAFSNAKTMLNNSGRCSHLSFLDEEDKMIIIFFLSCCKSNEIIKKGDAKQQSRIVDENSEEFTHRHGHLYQAFNIVSIE
jgi:hypothetical protein